MAFTKFWDDMLDNYASPEGGKMRMILWSVIVFHLLESLFSIYTALRQLSLANRSQKVPVALVEFMSHSNFTKARAYSLDRLNFSIAGFLVRDLVILPIEIVLCVLPLQWEISRSLVHYYGLPADNEMVHSCVFVLVTAVYETIKSLPWSMWSTFVIEQEHGFNKQTPLFFLKDQLKSFVVGQLLSCPIVCALIWIVRNGGPYFFLWMWLFAVVTSLVLVTLYPTFIAPLFDKYTELEPGRLRRDIEELAGRLQFPLTKLFVVEGSKRSAHSNAYFYGLWNSKRIVLFDTLLAVSTREGPAAQKLAEARQKGAQQLAESAQALASKSSAAKALAELGLNPADWVESPAVREAAPPADGAGSRAPNAASAKPADGAAAVQAPKIKTIESGCQNDEIVAVLAHELGHWKCGHVTKNIIVGQSHVLLLFLLFQYMSDNRLVYQTFGFATGEMPVVVGVMLLASYILSAYNAVMDLVCRILSRHFEYEADAFAVKLGYLEPLARALIKLNADNLGFPVYDWMYSAMNHSHPPLLHRLARMQRVAEEMDAKLLPKQKPSKKDE